MPIKHDENGVLTAYCDFCGNEAHKADDGWMRHNGFDVGRPKISIKCKKCDLGSLRGGVLIKGYGMVEQEKVVAIEQQQAVDKVNARRTKATVEQLRSSMNWAGIETAIKDHTFKIVKMAGDLNANPVELRDLLVEHFGDKITFKRGRNGGVFWTEGVANV